ncbi:MULTISPECIES: hypothetical protein [Xanthomonas]|uniref:hypothetical protein n=1 Tax=Xanthomonas TaxID=338 RepID=UPI000573652A|nr:MULTISPECIES: hypothetical protein [Xanthomonas]KHL58667.1 hypothetical protein OZ13_03605 [Xanthomonas cannabis pv. cannabis]MEA9657615.1 hypothetical protein [Xanthomonas campestris pv. raphani]MEB2181726.1 hypothetical protein [Xanthomonas campestris pv. campestris]
MTEKKDAERLMAELLGFAKKMLAQHGEFHPFGAYLSDSGEIVQVGVEGGSAREKAARIEASFRDLAARGGVRVFGVATNIDLAAGEGRVADAIQIFLEHRDGYCADVFFRYELDEGLTILETSAQQGDSRLFALSH